jgi:hypothetical protein
MCLAGLQDVELYPAEAIAVANWLETNGKAPCWRYNG